ncbi:MAG: hypothetical protein V3W41_02850 [Planctomycetota bacterium]
MGADIAFRENEARHRAKNCAANFVTLRHFALNLLKLDKTQKVGVANRRKLAGFRHEYLGAKRCGWESARSDVVRMGLCGPCGVPSSIGSTEALSILFEQPALMRDDDDFRPGLSASALGSVNRV